ncbi:hypothetical protein M407DRAFT_13205 [Tulasnella calospora MUT 4182]|uniref:Uncharacterized protein n=1 Tax=Tulasnella calospora MUT 4182 TaxID=1051891 RepID=A0A0C3K2J6_9AGAM|nr:hypothetical protein M407DRAFT_13205 [Tulasnella calospora MUT 4182]
MSLLPTPLPIRKFPLGWFYCKFGVFQRQAAPTSGMLTYYYCQAARLGKLPRPSRKGTGRADDPLLERMQVYGVLSSRTEIRGASTSKTLQTTAIAYRDLEQRPATGSSLDDVREDLFDELTLIAIEDPCVGVVSGCLLRHSAAAAASSSTSPLQQPQPPTRQLFDPRHDDPIIFHPVTRGAPSRPPLGGYISVSTTSVPDARSLGSSPTLTSNTTSSLASNLYSPGNGWICVEYFDY